MVKSTQIERLDGKLLRCPVIPYDDGRADDI